MADITWQRNGELLHALFDILHEHGADGLPAAEAIKAVEKRVGLTEYEAGHYDDGTRRFEKILRFSTIGPVKAGWLVKDEGQWYLTDEGWEARKKYKEPLEFVRRSAELYNAWKKGQPGKPKGGGAIAETPDEPTSPGITLEKAKEEARAEIERHLKTMNPYEFQDLVADLLRGMGYHVSWVARPGKDDGIDIVAFADPLGLRPPRIKVQVKRYDKPVPVGDVSAFLGNLGSEEVGLFVSTGNFTNDASAKVRNDKQSRVTLIGLDALVSLWIQHYDKLSQTARARLPLQPVYFLALDE